MQHRMVGAEIAACDRDARTAPPDVEKRNDDRNALRDDRRDGRAFRPHANRAEEDIVEHDVQHAGDGDEVHRTARVAEPAENRRNDVVCGNQRNAERAVIEVVMRANDGLLRRRHDGDEMRQQCDHNSRERDGDAEEQRDRVADGARDRHLVARTDRARNRDRRAHREADDDDRHHVHDLAADRDGRDARRAPKLADDEEIGHAVERLEKIRNQIGNREYEDVLSDTASREVSCQQISSLDLLILSRKNEQAAKCSLLIIFRICSNEVQDTDYSAAFTTSLPS